ncbi:MAG: UDP-N-acetylmuramoyl-L-alanyl-D-glutamate--2,6-diaminopimelate ligase [Clostridiales bacterium]|nr:UDP-N-acetylmuramoyl-L-alanyl-D-glutamate--2,6-diaminopimelate ligase [Clostridiales bacterium]
MMLKEILKGLDFEWVQGKNVDIEDIAIDSRKVKFDSLFVCLKGLRWDGHAFAAKAAAAGAAAIIIQDDLASRPENVTIVKTPDTRKALAVAASNFCGNPWEDFNLIGVTGTKGKTTTTYLMDSILREYSHKTGVIGTLGAKIAGQKLDIHYDTSTTPDPVELQQIFLTMKNEKVNDVVMEVSSQALAFEKLEGIKFNISIFTNLTQDHLDFHKNMENYKLAKAKLFSQSKHGVINVDSDAGVYMTKNFDVDFLTFSIDRPSDLQAKNIKYLSTGVEFQVSIKGVETQIFIPIKGRFTVYNALGVIGAALVMNIPVQVIQRGLSSTLGVPGRLQSVPNDRGLSVIVDYAHSPDSLVNIINAVREFNKGKLVVLFGCGGDRDKSKRPIMGKIAGELADYCIITSDNPRGEDPAEIIRQVEAGMLETNCPFVSITDRREAIAKGIEILEPGDGIIIAGKGHEDYQIIGSETLHFDDVEVASDALKALSQKA